MWLTVPRRPCVEWHCGDGEMYVITYVETAASRVESVGQSTTDFLCFFGCVVQYNLQCRCLGSAALFDGTSSVTNYKSSFY
jgi:hypothetical protein